MKVVAYRRYSPRPVVRHSMAMQTDAIEKWAAEGGHEIVSWYDDRGVSGGRREREGRDRLLRMLAAQGVQAVVVYDMSRWTREDDIGAAMGLISELRSKGTAVVSVKEQWLGDLGQYSDVVLPMMLHVARQERQHIASKSRDGLAAAQRRGVWLGKVPRFWRRINEIRNEPDGRAREGVDYGITCEDPDAIGAIFTARASGASFGQLERMTGLRENVIREVLGHQVNRQVVGDQMWELVQKARGAQRIDSRGYLLARLLFCPHCGARMVGQASRGWQDPTDHKTPHYRCKDYRVSHPWRQMSERRILPHLRAVLELVRLDEADRESVVRRLATSRSEVQVRREAQARELDALERRRRQIEEGVANGVIRIGRAREMLTELHQRQAEATAPIAEEQEIRHDLALLDSLWALVERAVTLWPAPEATRATNAVLVQVIDRIEWSRPTDKQSLRFVLNSRAAAIFDAVSATEPASAVRPDFRLIRARDG